MRVPRARRYILRVQPDGTLRCTVPRGGSRREAEEFVARQRRWIERERKRVKAHHGPREWRDGSALPLRGAPVRITTWVVPGGTLVTYGDGGSSSETAVTSGPRLKRICARWRAKSFLPGCQSWPPRTALRMDRSQSRSALTVGIVRAHRQHRPELPARPDAAQHPRLRARARADAFAPAESFPTVLEAGGNRLPAVS